jgi:hypothetical protein
MPFAREDFDSNYSMVLEPPTSVSSLFDIPWSTYLGSTFCAGSFGSVPTMELGVGGLHGCKRVFKTGKGPWMFWTLVIPNGVAEQESKWWEPVFVVYSSVVEMLNVEATHLNPQLLNQQH